MLSTRLTAAENFRRSLAACDCAAVQSTVLLDSILKPNAHCDFGLKHRFAKITSVRDFQEQVPICTYDDLRPLMTRTMQGEPGLLVSEPIRRFFLTSGSINKPKHVPVTTSLIRAKWKAFRRYWAMVRDEYPTAFEGLFVANFTDGSREQVTEGGIPCGSESSFWNAWSGSQSRTSAPIPQAVLNIQDSEARYYTIARLLLECNLTGLMALNPSTVLRLFQTIKTKFELLMRDISDGGLSNTYQVSRDVRAFVDTHCLPNKARASELRKLVHPIHSRSLWPNLSLIVTWRSSMLRPYIELLQPFIGGVPHRDYITMASEGIVGIPFESGTSGGALAVDTHFFEFIPEEMSTINQPATLLAHELKHDRNYVVVLTTSAGLYRYNIGDVVRVCDKIGTVPVVEFLHRTGHTCSLTGEKLTEEQVALACSEAAAQAGVQLEQFTLCPVLAPSPHYALLAEISDHSQTTRVRNFISLFDSCLCSCNLEYGAKRSSRRLESPELWLLQSGSYDKLRTRKVASGISDAQVKLPALTRDPEWCEQFSAVERFTCG